MRDCRNKFLAMLAFFTALPAVAGCNQANHPADTVTPNPIEILKTDEGVIIT